MPLKRTSTKAALGFAALAVIGFGLAQNRDAGRHAAAQQVASAQTAATTATRGQASDIQSPARPTGPILKTLQVSRGDTLMHMLVRVGVSANEASAAIDALRAVYSPRNLREGQAITVAVDRNEDDSASGGDSAALLSLKLKDGIDRDVQVSRDGDGFTARAVKTPLHTVTVKARGTIDSSLFESARNAGLPLPVLLQMIKIFSYDVDFQRDLQPGDTFEVMYDRQYDQDGRARRNGDILYAALTLSGQTTRVFRYEDADGNVNYYNDKGESVQKALMRTPIDGARLTSGFGRRVDPILGFSRVHKGVDFGAPAGTPIFAAGNGVIEIERWVHGYGNYIRIRHNSEFETAYAHMSAYAKGIHVGTHVHQGEVIGYVGSTGFATGPHLHFEVIKYGTQINPLSIKSMAASDKLKGAALKRFAAAKAKLMRQYAALPTSTEVAQATQN